MTLNDIKIVDLKRSVWDPETSTPAEGKYNFTKKVYYGRTSDIEGTHFPKWVTDDKQYNLQNWKYSYGAEEVKYEDGEWWPEPLPPNSSHGYNYMDAVLMKVNLEMWVNKVEKDRNLANTMGQANRRAFNEQMAQEDASLEVDPVAERQGSTALEEGKVRLV